MSNPSCTRVRRGRCFGALFLVGMLASPVLSPASGQQGFARVTANARLGMDNNDPFRGDDIPAVAADPADASHIVLVNQDFVTGNCEFGVTFDGGTRWDRGMLRAPEGFPTPPCRTLNSGGYPRMNQSVVFGSGQNVYTVFDAPRGQPQIFGTASFGQGQADSVLVARSSDGGRTFNTAVVAIEAPAGAPFPFYIRPTLGVQPRPDGDRVFVAAWGVAVASGGPADGAGERRLVTSASMDSGATWSAPVDASAPGEQIREPSAPVVGRDDAVYVAWRNRDTGAAPSNVIVGKSTDRGSTWTRNQAGVVTGLGQGVGGGMPQLAVDPSSGALYLVYQETQPHGDQDIFFQRSTDGAATWSSPTRVNDDAIGNKIRQHVPRVTLAPNGRIDVVWLDHRHAYPTPVVPLPRGEADVFYASSTDGGRTFTRNRRITDRTINLDMGLIGRVGSYSWYGPVATPLGNDAVFFAWSDPRDGNIDTDTNDIFTATLQAGAGAPLQIERMAASSAAQFSVELSAAILPGGVERISNPPVPSRLVLANEEDAPGVLAGGVLARFGYGSVLVAPPDGLSKEVKEEVGRLRPATVYVIGDETLVPAAVADQLKEAGARDVVRLGAADPAGTAVLIAEAMDLRSAEDKAGGKPAFPTAVVVNPDSDDAATAAGLAAALRFPVLFTESDTAVPPVTAAALKSLNVTSTIVIGGTETIGDAVLGGLPNAKRLGGANAAETSAAVAAEALALGLPGNSVFVIDADRRVHAGLAGVAAARMGGLLLVRDRGTISEVEGTLDRLQLRPMVDRLFLAQTASAPEVRWDLIIVSLLLATFGGGLLVIARARLRRGESGSTQPSGEHSL